MNLGDMMQKLGRKIPGHNWLSNSFMGDVVTGGLARGAERNNWKAPFGHDTSSFDDIFGAGASRTHGGRNLARGVGAAFGGGGLYALMGGGGAAGAGAGEGLGEAGGGGTGLGAGSGALEGGGVAEGGGSSSGGSSVMDWIRRGQQASRLVGGGGGQQPAGMNGVRGDMGTSIWSQIGLPQEKGRYSIDDVAHARTPTAYENAERLAARGRNGDTNLLHVSDEELAQLRERGNLTKNPDTGLPEAFNFGGMLGGAGNIFGGILGGSMGNSAAGDIRDAGNRGVSIGAPLENQQRQIYQQQLLDLLSPGHAATQGTPGTAPSGGGALGPLTAGTAGTPGTAATQSGAERFLSTDPFVQASQKALGNQYQANFAKSGNLPMEGILGSAAVQQMMSQAYNDRVKQLTTLGGFDQGPGYGGNIAYQSGRDAATIGNNARTGGINQILGGMGGMMGGSGSGMGGLFSGIGNLFGGGGGAAMGSGGSGNSLSGFPGFDW